MAIFVSYSRIDRSAAESVRHHLERARSSVWLDDELTGGQSWWDTILESIRSCELFVFLLSPDSLRSKACQAELRYAVELRRPLLPIMVRSVPLHLAPRVIRDTQLIDYTERTADSAVALVTAVATQRPAPSLPDPLPAPPDPPLSYMDSYRDQIQAKDLSFREQNELVLDLRGHLQDEDERDGARALLTDLRRRPDIVESVAKDIEELLAANPAAEETVPADAPRTQPPPISDAPREPSNTRSDPPTPAAAQQPKPAGTPAGWYADPTQRYELRFYDGSKWTEHVTTGGNKGVDPLDRPPVQYGQRPPAPSSVPGSAATGRAEPFMGGAYAGLIIATVFVGLVGVIVGIMNLKIPARRGQAQLLLWLGVASIVVGWIIVIGSY